MAKVTVTLDTDSNTCVVNIDGITIDNPSDISCYKCCGDEEKYSFSLSTREKNGKVHKSTYYSVASKRGQEIAKSGLAKKSKASASLLEVADDDLDILNLAEKLTK